MLAWNRHWREAGTRAPRDLGHLASAATRHPVSTLLTATLGQPGSGAGAGRSLALPRACPNIGRHGAFGCSGLPAGCYIDPHAAIRSDAPLHCSTAAGGIGRDGTIGDLEAVTVSGVAGAAFGDDE